MRTLSLLFCVAAMRCVSAPFTVMLDPGHVPSFVGAISCRAIEEMHYNDDLVELLVRQLKEDKALQVLTTRARGEEITLEQRAEKANREKVGLLIAIHHDSANPKYLVESEKEGKKAYCLSEAFRKKFQVGFSIFVSKKGKEFAKSLAFAEALGKEMVALKRPVSNYHTEPIENEKRTFLNEKWGVYQYDDLIVLKKAEVPAVLLEVGVISDLEDEAFVSKPENREALSKAIVRALQHFRGRK